jgi:hypothetical protein
VRSHSRLDLYAKSLAVTGLGCLGAIGAVIDHLPSRTVLPDVAAIVEREPVPSVLTVVNVPGYSPASSDFLSLEPIFSVTRRASAAPQAAAAAPRVVRANLVTTRPLAKVTFVGPTRPAPSSLAVRVEEGLPVLPVETLTELPTMPPPAWEPVSMTAVLASHEDESDGFLSSVWRKTGSGVGSVGHTITKAGGSVVGAFRSVGTLVKRAF